MKNKTIARAEAILATERKKRAKTIMRRIETETASEIARSIGISRQRVDAIVQAERAKAEK